MPKIEPSKLAELRPRITVIGVGGAGCNAINNMIATGLTGVTYVAANTDAQALALSSAEVRVQLGVNLTEGLGAGSKPEIGEAAAEEAIDDIRKAVTSSHMVFIAAGMGGGTGTGAASVIARTARELGILTVAIVSKPFQFEGTRRMRTALQGIEELRHHVDTLIVIPNQNLFRIANDRTTFAEAFVLADQVLYSGIACVVDLILKDGLINLDFADVRTVMANMGTAVMGTGEASGERRATLAAEEAISNPLLEDASLAGARGVLLSILGGSNLTLYEVDEAASRVRQEVDADANIIVGATFDEALGDRVRVSIVATGMGQARDLAKPAAGVAVAPAMSVSTSKSPSAPAPSQVHATAASTSHDPAQSPVAGPAATSGIGRPVADVVQSSAPVAGTAARGADAAPAVDARGTARAREGQADAVASPGSATQGGRSHAMAAPPVYREAADPQAGRASPPPAPRDPYLGDTEAEDFARALSAALGSDETSAPALDRAPPRNHETWAAPGGVRIEAATGAAISATPPRPSPPPSQAGKQPVSQPGFVAAAPAPIPRQPARIPAVEEFRPMAQRAYHQARSAQSRQPAAAKPQAPQNEPQRRTGLLGLLTGLGRHTDSQKQTPSAYPQAGKGTARPTAEHPPEAGNAAPDWRVRESLSADPQGFDVDMVSRVSRRQ